MGILLVATLLYFNDDRCQASKRCKRVSCSIRPDKRCAAGEKKQLEEELGPPPGCPLPPLCGLCG